ncbi:MAG TPA: ThuA domain-containing protein, partial [Vicinamibacterales bacterium]|nr:ThuA domain-containing protein [Vicinamibacterales bacterium]
MKRAPGRVLTAMLVMATGAGALAASTFLIPAVSSTPRSNRVLVFTRTTSYRHASIEPAVTALQRAGAPVGVTVESSEDVMLFTTEGLAPYGAVILLSTTGEPLGPPGRAIDALVNY